MKKIAVSTLLQNIYELQSSQDQIHNINYKINKCSIGIGTSCYNITKRAAAMNSYDDKVATRSASNAFNISSVLIHFSHITLKRPLLVF